MGNLLIGDKMKTFEPTWIKNTFDKCPLPDDAVIRLNNKSVPIRCEHFKSHYADWKIVDQFQISPDAEGWIPHVGDKCPVSSDMLVDVKFSPGQANGHKAHNWDWGKSASPITHYRPARQEQTVEETMQDLPEVGSVWQRGKGAEYTVLHIANIKSEDPDWVPMVVYQVLDGPIWARSFSEWHEKFTFVRGPAQQVTTWHVFALNPDIEVDWVRGETRDECIALANLPGWTMQGEPVEITIMKDAL